MDRKDDILILDYKKKERSKQEKRNGGPNYDLNKCWYFWYEKEDHNL